MLTNLADTIKTEKEQIQKQFSEEVEVLKKQLDEKTTEVSDKGKLILKVCHSLFSQVRIMKHVFNYY